ncbi:MAG: 3-isopropylmalate dehydratase large subunit [Rhodospirillaceae bacterium]|nr:3-isopropylmalate dehydratase large subunit [Rhodospirillaceae bacterium]
MPPTEPRTLFEKIWTEHTVLSLEGGESLIYVDRCLIHEGSRPGFHALDQAGKQLRRPAQVLACADHYIPSHDRQRGLDAIPEAETRKIVEDLEANAKRHGCRLFGLMDERQGILHVVAPELGIIQPGMVIVGGDSHTSTHGAFGALAFGIGASEVMLAMATQALWQPAQKTMRITCDGGLAGGVHAKDLILAVIGKIGTGGAIGYVIEYSGPAIRALSMEGRMTVCNMSSEAGARAGLVPADETTFAYLENRSDGPADDSWDDAFAYWRTLRSDDGAAFDAEVSIDAAAVKPMSTWGTSPEHCAALDGDVPDPADAADAAGREAQAKALEYMDLKPGQAISDIQLDHVFIGSCTNGRIEDLRAAAAVLDGRRARLPGIVVPGSSAVKRQAETEGLDRVFAAAGLEWREAACSLCTAVNGTDVLAPGSRSAATSNRNFPGRQGVGVRTHLMSPASAAASAVSGRITAEDAL